ncbi:hypothetical protein [Cohnella mopanensis]|uniref:hypothetical protein n=1 Tax=Cohnella mopanensis TaxID=2911966 RepID=UPI001EF7E9E4|nr:hypothetical protein [Cohnella mopanensis]
MLTARSILTILILAIAAQLSSCTSHSNTSGDMESPTITTETKLVEETEQDDDKAIDYLFETVTEASDYRNMLEANNAKMIIMNNGITDLADKPDKYIELYIGEDKEAYTVRWHTFYIREDYKEILIDNVVTGEILSLESWRQEEAQFELKAPRAVGQSIYGQLLIEPQSEESIHKLGAPSCYGLEEDYSISADYEVVFKTGSTRIPIQQLTSIEIINPKDETLQIKKVKMGDTELFYFIPRYTDCHSLEFYLFAMDEHGAYPITYLVDDKTIDQYVIYPKDEPKVVKNRFVFRGGFGAGMDTVSEYSFKFDRENHQMILDTVLQVKPN